MDKDFTFILNIEYFLQYRPIPVDNFWKDFHSTITVFCKEIYNFTPNLDI